MSPAPTSLRLSIASTWDGEPAEPGEIAQLELSGDARGLRVVVHASFHGDPPPEAPPGSLDGLWEHEVVELFIAGPGQEYLELELGPHGHYLALPFEGRRERAGEPLENIDYSARRDGPLWRGDALLPYQALPPGPHRVPGSSASCSAPSSSVLQTGAAHTRTCPDAGCEALLGADYRPLKRKTYETRRTRGPV